MADTFFQIPADGPGKKIASQSITRAAESHYRQEVVIGGALDAEKAVIINAHAATGYGLGVRIISGVASDDGSTPRLLKTSIAGVLEVSAAALPLPTGAATAAKQPALGTAGTAATDVISIQGIASMTKLQVNLYEGANALNSILAGAVRGLATPLIDAAGAQVVPALQVLDNNTTWAIGGKANPIGAVYDSTNADATDDKYVALRANIKRILMITPYSSAGAELNAVSEYQSGVSTAANPYGPVANAKRASDNGIRALALDDAGNLKVVGTGTGGTSASGNAAWTSTDALTPSGGVVDEAGFQTIAENKVAMVRLTPFQAYHVHVRDNAGVAINWPFGAEDSALNQGTTLCYLGARRADVIAVNNSDTGDGQSLKTDSYGRLRNSDRRPTSLASTPKNTYLTDSGDVITAPIAGSSLYIRRLSIHNRATTNRLVSLGPNAGTAVFVAEIKAEGGGVANIDFGPDCWAVGDNKSLYATLDAAGQIDVNVQEYYIAAA